MDALNFVKSLLTPEVTGLLVTSFAARIALRTIGSRLRYWADVIIVVVLLILAFFLFFG